jgi:predicted DNA binding CopG/RHH family protein
MLTYLEDQMRHQTHDQIIRFRANEALLSALRAKAERRCMSPSELLRDVLRREVLEAA